MKFPPLGDNNLGASEELTVVLESIPENTKNILMESIPSLEAQHTLKYKAIIRDGELDDVIREREFRHIISIKHLIGKKFNDHEKNKIIPLLDIVLKNRDVTAADIKRVRKAFSSESQDRAIRLLNDEPLEFAKFVLNTFAPTTTAENKIIPTHIITDKFSDILLNVDVLAKSGLNIDDVIRIFISLGQDAYKVPDPEYNNHIFVQLGGTVMSDKYKSRGFEDYDPREFIRNRLETYPRPITHKHAVWLAETSIPLVPVGGTYFVEALEKSRFYLVEWLIKKIEGKKLVPIKKYYDKFRKILRRKYYQSLVSDGEPVGLRASEAIGERVTQSNLNSFHFAGMFGAGATGLNRLIELVNATRTSKTKMCEIIFKDSPDFKPTFNNIMRRKLPAFTDVSMKDIITSIEIMHQTGIDDDPPWYGYYSAIYGAIHRMPYFMRIYLDRKLLMRHHIDVRKLRHALADSKYKIQAVISPLKEAIIDVYLNVQLENMFKTKHPELTDSYSLNVLIFQRYILPYIYIMRLSGIQGIKMIYPKFVSLDLYISGYSKTTGGWKIFLKNDEVHKNRIPSSAFINMIRSAYVGSGFPDPNIIVGDKIFIENPDISPERVLKGYNERLTKEMSELKSQQDSSSSQIKIDEIDLDIRRVHEQLQNFKLVMCVTDGTNLRDIFLDEDVDTELTFSNDPWEILQVLGIEALRMLLIREYLAIAAVDPRHIELLVNAITFEGTFRSMAYTSIQPAESGVMKKMVYDKTLENARKSAIFGAIDPAKSVTAGMIAGRLLHTGTGFSHKISGQERAGRKSAAESIKERFFPPEDTAEIIDASSDLNKRGHGRGFSLIMDSKVMIRGDSYTDHVSKIMAGYKPNIDTEEISRMLETMTFDQSVCEYDSVDVDDSGPITDRGRVLNDLEAEIAHEIISSTYSKSIETTQSDLEPIPPPELFVNYTTTPDFIKTLIDRGTQWEIPTDDEQELGINKNSKGMTEAEVEATSTATIEMRRRLVRTIKSQLPPVEMEEQGDMEYECMTEDCNVKVENPADVMKALQESMEYLDGKIGKYKSIPIME